MFTPNYSMKAPMSLVIPKNDVVVEEEEKVMPA
jgi:hypothetical protein